MQYNCLIIIECYDYTLQSADNIKIILKATTVIMSEANNQLNPITEAIRIQIPRTDEMEHSTPLYLTSSFTFDEAETCVLHLQMKMMKIFTAVSAIRMLMNLQKRCVYLKVLKQVLQLQQEWLQCLHQCLRC